MHDRFPILLAFGFLHPALLGWLAAAAIPVAIHLWSRRRYREISFAAMEYLLAAMKRQSQRLRLEQWLLMAVRILLILCIVLAASEPYLDRPLLSSAPEGRTHRMIILDGSFSMAYEPAEQSRFARAKEIAKEIVGSAPAGDAFTLLVMSSPPDVVVGTPSPAVEEVASEIDALEHSDTMGNVADVIPRAHEILEIARRENPRLLRHEVYFLTDLQRTAWATQGSKAAVADFYQQVAKLADAAALAVIDVGQPIADNLAVTALRLLTTPPIAGRTCRFEAVVKSYAARPAPQQSVELLVDGRRVSQRTVNVPAGGEATAVFEYRFDMAGDHAVEVRAEGDALSIDNRRYLAVPIRNNVRILCIEGILSGKPFGGASDYLAVALAPDQDSGAVSPIEVEVAPENAILERELSQYDCIAMCNVAQFTSGEADILSNYLRNGGNLLFFLGNQVMPERYNREIGVQAQAENRLLPAALGPAVEAPAGRLDPMEYRHPILHAFRGAEGAGVAAATVEKYVRLDLPPDSEAKVVLRLPGGDPLIVEQTRRRGRVVLVATSADTSWTTLPLSPSYVPLVQEIIAFCLADGAADRNTLVGKPLHEFVASAGDLNAVVVRTPDSQRREVRLSGSGNQREWTFADTRKNGIYAVRPAASDGEEQLFAVNVDTAESDLAQLGLDRLRAEVWPGIPFQYKTTWQEPDHPESVALRAVPGRLHILLLGAALGLLLLDTFLAWRFGHRTS